MNFASYVLDKISQVVSDPYSVREQSSLSLSEDYVILSSELITLYLFDGYYDLYLSESKLQQQHFRLFHLPISKEKEAFHFFHELSDKLVVLCRSCRQTYNVATLQKVCNLIRTHETWTPAHVAVEAGLSGVYHNLTDWLDSQSCEEDFTPLHIACQLKRSSIVNQLISCGADLSKRDDRGNTVIHLAVKVNYDQAFDSICRAANEKVINLENNDGESALHIACKQNKPEMCKVLLSNGARVVESGSVALPIHYALKHRSLQALEVLLIHNPQLVHEVCKKHGGTPLHWCKQKEEVNILYRYNTPTETMSQQKHLPLHIMVLRDRLEAAVAVILGGGQVNGVGKNGNTALHVAVMHDCVLLVKMLLLFGADHTIQNDFGETPGIMAIRSAKPNKKFIVELLTSIGGIPNDLSPSSSDDNTVDEIEPNRLRVLCLDGGGIRGLVSTQILMAVEKACGKKSKDLFDWIVGTSTGGILALALAQGKSAVSVQRLYFRLKDEVFIGSRPYSSEPMEEFLKREFGESTTMESISDGPNILVTAALVDRKPMCLHFFKNYSITDQEETTRRYSKTLSPKELEKLQSTLPSTKELLWKAARSSGAAPTYFRPMDRFLDGGVIANNPTLDALTEIHRYNKAVQNSTSEKKPEKIGVVLSIGTGQSRTTTAKSVDVIWPTNPIALVNTALAGIELSQMMIDVACESNSHVVERAKAWCEMIGAKYHRLNSFMDEDLALDEKDNEKLLNLMWETHVYIHKNRDAIQKIAKHICRSKD